MKILKNNLKLLGSIVMVTIAKVMAYRDYKNRPQSLATVGAAIKEFYSFALMANA